MEFQGSLRGADAEGNHHVQVLFSDWLLCATVDREGAVTGSIAGIYRSPSIGRTVTRFVDRMPCETVVTDAFGQFAFPPRLGTAVGVRIEYGHETVHVSLADLGNDANGSAPGR